MEHTKSKPFVSASLNNTETIVDSAANPAKLAREKYSKRQGVKVSSRRSEVC